MALDHLPLLHLWFLTPFTIGYTIAYTPPHATLRMLAVLTTILIQTYFQYDATTTLYRDMRIAGPFAAMGWVNVLNGIELSLLSRASFDAQRNWEVDNKISPKTGRVAWALWMPFNMRRLRSPWEIPRIPPFTNKNNGNKDPAYVPEKRDFLLQCIAKIVLRALLIAQLTVDLEYPGVRGQLDIMFGAGGDEVSILRRAVVTAGFMLSFLVITRAVIVGLYTFFALVCVGLGVSDVAVWRPISGSVLEAWSIRRLWGITWHQMLRTALLANTDLFLCATIRLPRNSRLRKTVRLLLVFALSGAVHVGLDLGFGVSLRDSGALTFFTLQGVGILTEEGVQWVWYDVHGLGRRRRGLEKENEATTWERVVGYLWTSAFLGVTAPVWVVPMFRGMTGEGIRPPVPLTAGWGVLFA